MSNQRAGWPTRIEPQAIIGSRQGRGVVPGDPDSLPRPPGQGPPATNGGPRDQGLKWSQPYTQLGFAQADQNADFGSRLWLGAGTPVTRGIWASTVLDCRKDLQGSDGYQPVGTPLVLTEPSGILLEMFVKIRTTAGAVPGMFGTPAGPATTRVLLLEYGDPFVPTEISAYTAPIDITAQVFSGNGVSGDVILRLANNGPLRYWQAQIAIDIVAADFATLYGPVKIEAACY